MASGKIHITGTLLLTPLTAGLAWHLTGGDVPTTALASAGCLSGVIISPDLDMANRTISETVVIRWLGVLGYLWMVLWKPYACLHKHRGISHVPLIGTLTRVGYLAGCYMLMHCVAREFYQVDLLTWPQQYWQHLLIIFAGLTISDVGHWVLDDFAWR